MRKMTKLASATAVLLVACGVGQIPAAADTRPEVREVFSPDGTIRTATVEVPDRPRVRAAAPVVADVVAVQQTGTPQTRYDLVFIGDGYTADEQDLFGRQVRARWDQLTAREPFRTLRDRFNVWQVNAVSAQSGADNDPVRGDTKDTALGGGFWCGGMDRLVCVDPVVTQRYAALAPAVDQALVLVNSATYGGSGGTIGVSSGGNPQSGEIVVHELGHSIGGLADEYGGPGSHTGAEPAQVNLTTADEATMRAEQIKWHEYLGRPTPDGGVIGVFEGGAYVDRGVFRPSEDSIMRTLGREFNLVGLDRMTYAILARSPS